MAFIQINFMSECLLRTVNVNVVLPVDKIVMPDKKDEPIHTVKEFKTLYLLHGIFGSQVDWINGTNLQRWAEENNLCVVMPAGENGFYVDQKSLHNHYGEFIGRELVDVTRKMFPLSHKKEDTFIGGLSMGGYGALRNGLKYKDTFGYIAGLSSASMIDYQSDTPAFLPDEYLTAVFGNLEEAKNSDVSIHYLMDHDEKKDQKIYLACGESDSLLSSSESLYKRFKELGYDVTYETGPGAHEWDFWNRYIKKVLDWLPLDNGQSGLSSGNVGI